jgi:hypothetical protein
MDPFAALADLAREEHRLVADARYEELAELDERRSAVLAALPPVTPPHAVEDLREAARLQALITVALRCARDAARDELVRMDRTREGLRGYAASAG